MLTMTLTNFFAILNLKPETQGQSWPVPSMLCELFETFQKQQTLSTYPNFIFVLISPCLMPKNS